MIVANCDVLHKISGSVAEMTKYPRVPGVYGSRVHKKNMLLRGDVVCLCCDCFQPSLVHFS